MYFIQTSMAGIRIHAHIEHLLLPACGHWDLRPKWSNTLREILAARFLKNHGHSANSCKDSLLQSRMECCCSFAFLFYITYWFNRKYHIDCIQHSSDANCTNFIQDHIVSIITSYISIEISRNPRQVLKGDLVKTPANGVKYTHILTHKQSICHAIHLHAHAECMNVWYNNKCSRIAPEISYNKNNLVASGILKLLNACAMSQIILNPRMEGLCTYVHTHTQFHWGGRG